MELFIFLSIGLVLYFIISPVIRFYKRYRTADKYSLLPFVSWIGLIQTKNEKERDAMAHGLLVQSANLLVQVNEIPSINTIMSIFYDKNICKTNFIINILNSNSLHIKEDQIEDYQNSLSLDARAFFAAAIYAYIHNHGGFINDALYLATRHAEKPFKGWD